MPKGNTQRPCMNLSKDQKTMSTNNFQAQPPSTKGTETKTQQHKIESSHSQQSLRSTFLQVETEPQPSIKVQKEEEKQLHPPRQNRQGANSIELIVNKMKQGIQTINKKTIEKVGGDVVTKLKEFVEKEKDQFKKKNEEEAKIVRDRMKAIEDMQVRKLEEMRNEMKGRQGRKIEQELKLSRKMQQLQKERKQIGVKLQEANDKNKQNEQNKKMIIELKTKLQRLNTQNQYLEHDNKRLTQIKQDNEAQITNLSNKLANRQIQLIDVKKKFAFEQKIRNQLEKQIKVVKDDVKKAKSSIVDMFGYRVQGSNNGANGANGNGNGNLMGIGGQRRNNDMQEIERVGISQVYANCLQPFTKFRDRFMPIAKKLIKVQINNDNCSSIQQIQQFNQLKTLLTFLPPQPSQTTSLKTISTLLSTLLQHLSTQITYTSNIKKYIVSLQQSMKIINNIISEIIKNGSYHSINVIKDYNGKESCVYREMRDIAEKVKEMREGVGREREEMGRERGERVRLEGVVKEMKQYIGQLEDFKSKSEINTKKYQQKLSQQTKQTQKLKLHIETLQKSLQNSTLQNSTLTQQLQQKKQEITKIEAQNKIQWGIHIQKSITKLIEQKTRIKVQYQNLKKLYDILEGKIGEEKRKYGEIQRNYEERLREKDEVIGGLRAEADKLSKLSQFVHKFAENSE